MTNETAEQLCLFGQDLWFGKMSPEHSPRQTAKTSGRLLKKPSELQTTDYQFLDLRPGGGNLLGPCWETNSPSLGEFWMLNTGASPKDAVESSLSQILQGEVPQRYYLSKTACLGILRRAHERGKELPAQLKTALEIQAGLSDTDTAEIKTAGFDGYNGDLTGEKAATLGVNCGMSTGRNGVLSGTPTAFAANQRDEVRDLHDVAGALGASPGMKQQTFVAAPIRSAGFNAGAGPSAGTIGYAPELAPTLKGSASGNMMPTILCLNDQGGAQMHCTEDRTGTLRAQEHGHQPLVYENHGIDSRYTGPHKVAPTMSARYGTGGNNVPLVSQEADVICIAGNAIDRQPQNGGNGLGCQPGISYTLTATDHHAVFSRQRSDIFMENDVVSTQSARQHKDATDLICHPNDHQAENNGDYNSPNDSEGLTRLIRRLTPLECERLQGFPDGWTDIPDASDSARYKALGNSVAIPCVEFVLRGIAAVLRKAADM
jgi:hypothetical protein